MTIDKLFEEIFNDKGLKTQPPVLIDIGASGNLHVYWQKIAKYSVCVAFDADERDMAYINGKAKNFKQLHVINKIVTDKNNEFSEFHLTSSPYCSSLLPPDNKSLVNWRIAELFIVDKKISLPSISLEKALGDLNLTYVDWFKSDSQGLDTRLFKNMGAIQHSTIVADFEPGFIDAYIGEDKIHGLIEYMEQMPFWISNFKPFGNQRVKATNLTEEFTASELELMLIQSAESPIGAEITYFNSFDRQQVKTERYYLLGCAFALILKQYPFAAELAIRGFKLSGNGVFNLILQYIKQTTGRTTIAKLITQPVIAKQKIVNRLILWLKNYKC